VFCHLLKLCRPQPINAANTYARRIKRTKKKSLVYVFYRYHWRNYIRLLVACVTCCQRPGLFSSVRRQEHVKNHDNLQDGTANQCTSNVSIRATFRFLLLGKQCLSHSAASLPWRNCWSTPVIYRLQSVILVVPILVLVLEPPSTGYIM